jgi:hypothetical protein
LNTLLVLTCSTCEQDIDCRIGFSNRGIQPLALACPHCNAGIGITLDTSRPPSYSLEFSKAQALDERQYAPFDGRNPFVDLHLDFPVSFGGYTRGLTPYFAAINKLDEVTESRFDAHALIAFHNQRLNQLNYFANRSEEVRTVIKLYFGKNKQLFKRRVEEILAADMGPSMEQQDINAALYTFVSFIFLPFLHFESVAEFVKSLTNMVLNLANSNPDAFNSFIDHLSETKFVNNLQRDSLGLYPAVYEAELALRPALFLDFLPDSEDRRIAGRVSAHDFKTYKDLYKDLCEVLGRQLVLVAGINNIIHRNSHDAFALPKDGAPLSSLDKFANKTLSEKLKYLDDCWFLLDKDVLVAGVRNAIAHHTVQYDEVSQVITYFPEKEGVRQEKGDEMTFLAFMRLILQIFREVHYLQHVIKTLLFYEILIRSKARGSKAT